MRLQPQWFFTGLWAVISPWIDPVTANKIRIVGSSYISSLRELIANEEIPEELGGARTDLTWEWPFPENSGCTAFVLALPLKNELKYAAATSAAEDTETVKEGDERASM